MSILRAYAQLVRLPNLPTALADICLGALAGCTSPGQGVAFGLLLAASACLYSAGMVWNDYFDQEQDRRERPFRPLPSGRVSPQQAVQLGVVLLAAGVLLALAAGGVVAWREGRGGWTPAVLAVCLAAAILLYDGWLKRTWAGPLGMGACRFLNVLLGVSACGSLLWPRGAHLALVVGLYIVGVTWFARTEARLSSQTALRGAAAVMLAALLLALPLPLSLPPGQEDVAPAGSFVFPYLLVGLGFVVGLPVSQALANPTPSRVQAAVKRCLVGLVLLDAVLATAVAGAVGLLILLLLAPSVYLNRKSWLYAT
jgi:4-hydroxybenzoate polyprenyltransferase